MAVEILLFHADDPEGIEAGCQIALRKLIRSNRENIHRPFIPTFLGQTDAIAAADVCTNDLIPGANTFDVEKVKADAAAATLTEDMAAVDVEAIRATMFDQAI